jgi:hypothetical protein
MLLHPSEALTQFHDEYTASLATLNGCLNQAAQETFSRWSDRNPKDVDQSVFAGCVRQSLTDLLKIHLPRGQGAIDCTTNCGVHLYFRPGQRTRVRKRPTDLRAGTRIEPTPVPEALFGDPYPPYEIAALWTLNLNDQQLGSSVLAALTSLDEPHLTAIYAEHPLPPARPLLVQPFNSSAIEPGDDFEDFFDGGEASVSA